LKCFAKTLASWLWRQVLECAVLVLGVAVIGLLLFSLLWVVGFISRLATDAPADLPTIGLGFLTCVSALLVALFVIAAISTYRFVRKVWRMCERNN
jgi:uncharacterized BrkB/YihY/UPF0761 family membrane protein